MKLVLAEKPSVGVSLANLLGAKQRKDGYIEGNGYIVSWCIGHLVGLADAGQYDEKYRSWKREDLPIIPETWEYIVFGNKKKQFNIIKRLMSRKDVTGVICATDAGREGELIFRYVYEMAGCGKPVMRLWISSMEEAAVRMGFKNLKDSTEYDNLYQSALCRAKADWIIGINATRLFSSLYGKTLNVGRVQTPTLAMLAERQAKIDGFSKEKYYKARLSLGGVKAFSENITDIQKAEQIQDGCNGHTAKCVSLIYERKTEAAPKLFDLTSLQRESNRLFGFTAKQALDIAQKLYEGKLITYPRTDSKYITSDMAASATALSASIMPLLGVSDTAALQTGQVVSNSKVTDHHAIIPTHEYLQCSFDKLAEPERKLLLLVAYRFIASLCSKHVYETATAVFECSAYVFTARGKKTVSTGWKDVESLMKLALGIKSDSNGDNDVFPDMREGQEFDNADVSVTEHFTQPPKPYTEDTLLLAMEKAGADETDDGAERKGLGTPATRAAIIEKLVTGGFVVRKGRQLIPIDIGANLISVLPQELTSPSMTAEWENMLALIVRGEVKADDFIRSIETMTKGIVSRNAAPKAAFRDTFKK